MAKRANLKAVGSPSEDEPQVSDLADAITPMMIPVSSEELQPINQAQAFIRQLEENYLQQLSMAQNQIQATLWQLAMAKGVDLSKYEFNMQQQGFVKK